MQDIKKRKQYLVDRQYQRRMALSIILVVTLITASILAAIATSVVYNNGKIENIYEIEGNIVEYLSSQPMAGHDEALKQAIQMNLKNHDRNMATLKKIITYNKILLVTILAIIILQGIILYIILIRKTHRISGPIYVMKNFMKEIIAGEEPDLRPLRETDELKDFYELFKEMVTTLKKN